MSTLRKRRGRVIGGVPEGEYQFFSFGPFFDGEEFAEGKSEADLQALWRQHRREILGRYLNELKARGPGWAGTRPENYWRDLEAAGDTRREIGVLEWWGPWQPGGQEKRITPVFEDDVTFLARVRPDDLEPWELEARNAERTGGMIRRA